MLAAVDRLAVEAGPILSHQGEAHRVLALETLSGFLPENLL